MTSKKTVSAVVAAVTALTGLSLAAQTAPADAHATAAHPSTTSHGAPPAFGQSWREAANTKTAIALVNGTFLQREVEKSALRYLDVNFIQHNPDFASGRAAYIAGMTALVQSNPHLSYSIKRTIAQGDLVVLQILGKFDATNPNDRGLVVVDTFRFNNKGKIVEHWDALQPVAEHSANGNPQV